MSHLGEKPDKGGSPPNDKSVISIIDEIVKLEFHDCARVDVVLELE